MSYYDKHLVLKNFSRTYIAQGEPKPMLEAVRRHNMFLHLCTFIAMWANGFYAIDFSLMEKRRSPREMQAEGMLFVSQYAPPQWRRTSPVSNGVLESLLSPSRPSFLS